MGRVNDNMWVPKMCIHMYVVESRGQLSLSFFFFFVSNNGMGSGPPPVVQTDLLRVRPDLASRARHGMAWHGLVWLA